MWKAKDFLSNITQIHFGSQNTQIFMKIHKTHFLVIFESHFYLKKKSLYGVLQLRIGPKFSLEVVELIFEKWQFFVWPAGHVSLFGQFYSPNFKFLNGNVHHLKSLVESTFPLICIRLLYVKQMPKCEFKMLSEAGYGQYDRQNEKCRNKKCSVF